LTNANCDIKSPKDSKELTNFIWHVALNVLEIFLIILGYLTGFYFLYGGFLFIASQGKPETAAKARMTMVYAVFGLVAALVSVALVNFVVEKVLG
jgi:multisubunit Na+/H+ antiporter MnhE subunit